LFDLRPLRSPTFRHLAAAYLINEFGTWIGEVALAVLVFNRTGSPLATAGLFLALRFLPSLAAPFVTSWVESASTRVVLPALYLLEAALYAGIAVLASHFWLPGVLILTAADGAITVVAKALTRSANANELIRLDRLRDGNALLNMGVMASSALGPALAGVLLAWKGAGVALAVDAATFVVAAVIIFTATGLHVESDHEVSSRRRLLAGVAVIRDNHTLFWLLVAFGLVMLLSSVAVPVEVVFAERVLHSGDRGYGVLLGAWGVGMLIGGSAFAFSKRVGVVPLLIISGLLLAAGYGGLAAAPNLLVACLFSALGGIGNGIGGITAITAIQQAIPLRAQSVVMAVFETINQAAPALGFVVGGVVTALGSARDAYAVSAAGVALLVAGAVMLMSTARYARVDEASTGPTTMSATTEPSSTTTDSSRLDRRVTYAAVIDVLLLVAVVVASVLTAHLVHLNIHFDNWNIGQLLIILVLTIGSEVFAVPVTESKLSVSGSFLGVMLAAVLLGGPPAAIAGLATIIVGWLRFREEPLKLLHNLATYAVFPFVAALVLYELKILTGANPDQAEYYILILATFVAGLAVNLTLSFSYTIFALGRSVSGTFDVLKSIFAPELFSAVLTLVSAYVIIHLGAASIVLIGLVIGLFQYLVGELLQSRARGEQLRVQATTDSLTGLYNAEHFTEQLTEVIEHAAEHDENFAVMLLNLDHFKDVNDTLGHEYGNELLQLLAPRLAEHVGGQGILARFAGDGFIVLPSPHTSDTEQLEAIAADLRACVRDPITVGEITISVNSSVGIACYPRDGADPATLIRRADIAMHDAKQQRDSDSFYEPERDHHSALRLSLLGDFRRALESPEQIVLVYHPIVKVATNTVDGAEALVRWRHPELGLLSPGSFLSPVEHTALIGPMTAMVLDQAVRDVVAWESEDLQLSISVNLSVRNLYDRELPAQVEQTLARHGLAPQRLKLEITESMFLADLGRVLETADELRSLGVRLAVDDFGTGHASLANLRSLPVDELKIDRSFVTPMLSESSDMVIVRSTIELAHALGLQVVAEGVEQRAALDVLQRLHCDRAQGHYFTQPLLTAEFVRWAHDFAKQ
jgi:diguanylate cyclase (GGDEF)-like protein